MSLDVYRRVRTIAETPRAQEYRLMSQITGEMTHACDRRLSGPALVPSLHRNREVWGVFASQCAAQGNGLPDDLRASIISIALWVDRYTSEVAAGRDSIDDLITVNRAIIDGLANENLQAA